MPVIVKPSCELRWTTPNALQEIERAGRVCYKSEDKITDDSAVKFVRQIMKRGHHAVIEHAVASFYFVCDRGVTHEMVRHRLAAYCQESTRYCNYGADKFNGQLRVIEPPFKNPEVSKAIWDKAMAEDEKNYLELIAAGEPPQIARSVLPTCLKTEIIMTCNFREWLHVFSLRSSQNNGAHPQIIEIMDMAQDVLANLFPVVFLEDHSK